MAVSSGFVSIRMDALRAIDYLDEAFIYSYDDWDLGYRLWSAGYITIHEPAVQGTHLRAAYGGARQLDSGKRGHLNKLTAKYYFLSKHFSARAMRVELLTDLFFALADGNWNPFSVIGDWRNSTRAYRAASAFHSVTSRHEPASLNHSS
jgi:GT2 family glycosyltransferase